MRIAALLPKALREARGRAAFCRPAPNYKSNGGIMKLRVVVCLLGFASLVGVTAQAQELKTIDVFAGYSYVRANRATSNTDSISLNGAAASMTTTLNNGTSEAVTIAACPAPTNLSN